MNHDIVHFVPIQACQSWTLWLLNQPYLLYVSSNTLSYSKLARITHCAIGNILKSPIYQSTSLCIACFICYFSWHLFHLFLDKERKVNNTFWSDQIHFSCHIAISDHSVNIQHFHIRALPFALSYDSTGIMTHSMKSLPFHTSSTFLLRHHSIQRQCYRRVTIPIKSFLPRDHCILRHYSYHVTITIMSPRVPHHNKCHTSIPYHMQKSLTTSNRFCYILFHAPCIPSRE